MILTAEKHPLTWRLRGDGVPVWLDEYQAKQGYEAVKNTVGKIASQEVTSLIKASGLRGRGGAGFPTGVKWSLVPMGDEFPLKYLLCNADEMEPGTYKDRLLMEQLPHQLIEGMILAAWAMRTYRGYIFLRGEYVRAAENLRRAIDEAREAGFLGRNILGSGFDFELSAYRCWAIYLWRRDCPDQFAGGASRQSEGQAAISCFGGGMGQTHLCQQCGNV